MIIELPFPDSRLSPNRKNGTHWSKTDEVKKQAFEYAYYATQEAIASQKFSGIPIELEMIFVAPDLRKRDLDNMLASSKAYIDGMCAALKIDDYIFEKIILRRGYEKGKGRLVVKLTT